MFPRAKKKKKKIRVVKFEARRRKIGRNRNVAWSECKIRLRAWNWKRKRNQPLGEPHIVKGWTGFWVRYDACASIQPPRLIHRVQPPRLLVLPTRRDKTYTRTGIAVDHAKSVRVPVTEELTANDVRVQPDQLEIFGIVTFAQHRRTALTIVHPWWCVTYDVHLKTLHKVSF